MNPAGRLSIAVREAQGRILGVRLDSSRPQAARLLCGRSPGQAAALVPALFSLCGRAQGLAARLALDAALGQPAGADPASRRAVEREAAREHLWRLMLDWPVQLGEAPLRERFAALHRRLLAPAEGDGELERALAALLEESGLHAEAAEEPAALAERAHRAGPLGRCLAALIRSERPDAAPAARAAALLPALSAAQWAARLGGELPGDDFRACPTLDGGARETGALARCAALPVVAALLAAGLVVAARFAARIVELGRCASEVGAAEAVALSNGIGLARVETARGLLLHVVRVEQGRVADYAIVAPTEWNFHPRGVFVRESTVWPEDNREALRARLERLALALDPCVEWSLHFEEHADA